MSPTFAQSGTPPYATECRSAIYATVVPVVHFPGLRKI